MYRHGLLHVAMSPYRHDQNQNYVIHVDKKAVCDMFSP